MEDVVINLPRPRPRPPPSPTTPHYKWKSCCFELEREFTVFITKYIIIVSLLIFFAVELHLSDACEDKNLYQSLLMIIIGLALPNPKLS